MGEACSIARKEADSKIAEYENGSRFRGLGLRYVVFRSVQWSYEARRIKISAVYLGKDRWSYK